MRTLKRKAMMDLFYYNAKGNREGPHSEGKIKELATRRIIKRETIIENDKGQSTKAETIPWIEFPQEIEPAPPKPIFKWLTFFSKFAASLATLFGSIWTFARIARFLLIFVVFLGIASIVGAIAFRIVWYLLFQ